MEQRGDKAYLEEGISLFADVPEQAIIVTGAAYGHPTNGGKRYFQAVRALHPTISSDCAHPPLCVVFALGILVSPPPAWTCASCCSGE